MHGNGGGITEEVRMMVEHGVISPEDAMRMLAGEEQRAALLAQSSELEEPVKLTRK